MSLDIHYTDNVLLEQLAQDNKEAFSILYRRYWVQLYEAALRRLNNRAQAEDIVQDVFVSLWRRRSEAKIENLAAYLSKAVRYRVLNYVLRDQASESFYEPFEELLIENGSADEKLLNKEFFKLIVDYIESLPEKRKKIFVLHIYNNLSTKEIAEKLLLSQKTVQNQLGRAMGGLRKKISPVIFAIISSQL